MKLVLKWMSKEKRQYSLGVLEKIDGKYIFETNEVELKKAIQDGCMGIGNFTFLEKRMESQVPFIFRKNLQKYLHFLNQGFQTKIVGK